MGLGNNQGGFLGDGTFNTPDHPIQIVPGGVVAVACGEDFTIFLKNDGSVWGFGWSGDGELGFENSYIMQPKQIINGDVVAIAAGYLHTLFIKRDGSLWGMGINWNSDYGEGIEFGIETQSRCPTQIFAANNPALVAGYYYSAQLKTCVSLWAGKFNNNPAGVSSSNKHNTSGLLPSVASLPGSNLITIELLLNGNVRLTYSGNAEVNYVLDRSASLSTPNWMPQTTNAADSNGVLVITNTPDTTENNFWRIRSVQ